MEDNQNFLSMNPDEAVEGGAVPDNIDLTVVEARVHLFDYQGKAPATIALGLKLQDDEGGSYNQEYSYGPPDRYMANADGKRVIGLGSTKGVVNSSNAYLLFQAFVNAGFPKDKMGPDVSVLEGCKAHFQAQVRKASSGMSNSKDKQISLPVKVLKLPWEKAVKKAAGKAASAGGAAGGVAGGELTPEAIATGIEFINEVLAEQESGTITRSNLVSILFGNKVTDPERKKTLSSVVFLPQFKEALSAAGFQVQGEVIGRPA